MGCRKYKTDIRSPAIYSKQHFTRAVPVHLTTQKITSNHKHQPNPTPYQPPHLNCLPLRPKQPPHLHLLARHRHRNVVSPYLCQWCASRPCSVLTRAILLESKICACEDDCPILDNHQRLNSPPTSTHLYIFCR